ncbi:acyltransferase family protein [Chelatococcus reniformis]|uniref:Acyltransferase 3 domain-containing protein n=1 Tax=Chelatococcus reniformis TaxID=1494448 RepID=A0A916XG10_9HYPH|nr:acyltransferase [Chelatococcus reniformis]GGC67865.1 hypothetical protein GCM10010994_28050 [Chelatococcus reniformis]
MDAAKTWIMTDKVTSLPYVGALDGLRAIAVLSVVLGHFGLPGFAVGGGYGVDVFFVLSGYLITLVLLKGDEQNRSLGVFYWHRVTRLLPLLAVVSASLFLLPQVLLSTWGATINAIGALTYTANWTRAYGVPGWPSYMAHTWTLAVEEQFYLLWPAVLIAVRTIAGRRTAAVILGLTAAALVWLAAMTLGGASIDRIYNGFDTHAPGLLIGCLLALLKPPPINGATFTGAVLAYLALICLVPWSPGGATAIWLLSCIFICFAVGGARDSLAHRALSWRPLVFVGIISYGIYLWHYPVHQVLTHLQWPPAAFAGIGIATSIALAWASRRLVEDPCLRARSALSPRHQIIAGFTALALTIAAMIGGLVYFFGGFLASSPY